jgi:hypothetical protein
MIEAFLTFGLIVLFAFLSLERGLVLFVFLLPFHAFIKNIFNISTGGGTVFSFWKEVVIILFLIRIIHHLTIIRLPKYTTFFFTLFILTVLFYFLISDSFYYALGILRNHVFTLLVFLVFSNFWFSRKNLKALIVASSISFMFHFLMGFVQNFFLKIPIGYLMGRIEFINSRGYIQYTTNSARIGGVERMAGLIGGPNDFGLFVSLSLLFLLTVWLSQLKNILKPVEKTIMISGFIAGAIALLYSFSRAGIVLFIGSFVTSLFIRRTKGNLKFRVVLMVALVALITFLTVSTESQVMKEIYNKTLSGEELSAADRFSNVGSGIEQVAREPFGHGLATADNSNPKHEFFAESAYLNLLYEIGIFGFIFLSIIFFLLALRAYNLRNKNIFAPLTFALLLLTYFVSFFSVNTYGMPYVLLVWIFIGLGVNQKITQLSIKDESINNYNSI